MKTYDVIMTPSNDGNWVLKSEADKVIAEKEESHKMEVEQLLMEIVGLKKQVALLQAKLSQNPENNNG